MTTRPWPSRIYIKMFGAGEFWPRDPGTWIPLFQRWIREDTLPGTWVDVVDYSHVADGPIALLAGFEGQISVDLEDGKPGLLYQSRQAGDLQGAVDLLIKAVAAIEAAPEIQGKISFRRDQLLMGANDRLHWHGESEVDDTWAALAGSQLTALGYAVRSSEPLPRDPGERPRALVTFQPHLDPR